MKNRKRYLTGIILAAVLLCTSCGKAPNESAVPGETTSVPGTSAPAPATEPESTAVPTDTESTSVPADTETAPGSATAGLPVNPLIPAQRISVYRNGLNQNFHLSETGIYCLSEEKAGVFILYCDADSDEFIKVCGRPDCLHHDETCDAFLDDTMIPSMGYYNGKIYYIKGREEIISSTPGETAKLTPHTLMRMDADGRNKQELTYCYEEGEDYAGWASVGYSNGIVECCFSSVGADGQVVSTRMFTRLEDPGYFIPSAINSELPSELREPYGGIYSGAEGRILLSGGPDEEKEKLYLWDYDGNSVSLIGNKPMGPGTFTAGTGYYMDGGTVMQWDYEKQEGTPLFDTGFEAPLALAAFPDCFAVYDNRGVVMPGEPDVTSAAVRFYSWDFEQLGECELQLGERSGGIRLYGNYVFGETETRILLVKDALNSLLPDYYIEKADFGTGSIPLHEYHYPLDMPVY
ncbi:MAG: hypothetical protein J5493_05120 [Lachnospiraceae bacterium]|nr:hypothetical protein [Lachnospiraceae bacterium]